MMHSNRAIQTRRRAGRHGLPGAGLRASSVRGAHRQSIRNPKPSIASVPAMPVPRTSLIAGTILQGTKLPMRVWFRAMHLLAQGKKGLSNIELGRRLGNSTNAAWRLQHKLMQAILERDRRYKLGAAGPRIEIDDAYVGGERSGEGSGRGRRGHTPFIAAIETSDDSANRCTPASRWCTGSVPAKPNAYAPGSWPEPPSSATAASGFAASPSSRVSSTSATSPAPVAPLPATLPSATADRRASGFLGSLGRVGEEAVIWSDEARSEAVPSEG